MENGDVEVEAAALYCMCEIQTCEESELKDILSHCSSVFAK